MYVSNFLKITHQHLNQSVACVDVYFRNNNKYETLDNVIHINSPLLLLRCSQQNKCQLTKFILYGSTTMIQHTGTADMDQQSHPLITGEETVLSYVTSTSTCYLYEHGEKVALQCW